MNQTTFNFLKELHSKQLNQYTLSELQIALEKTARLHARFSKGREAFQLSIAWNKMAAWYNATLLRRFPQATSIYPIDYLINKTYE